MMLRPRRSALYMPALNARAIEKARGLPCDVVILDLEDAVAPEMKAMARDQAIAAVGAGGFGARELVVRVNALDTAWGADDIAALAQTRPDAVLLPKVSEAATLHAARAALGAGTALWAMIETCRAIVDLPLIAAVAPETGLTAFVVGPNDLAKEMRCRPGVDRAPLLSLLSQVVLVARTTGLVALDGVMNVLDDEAAIEAECRQGLAFGFDGKTLIHPNQIASANRVFGPTDEDVRWAHVIVAAFAGSDRGALRIGGKMVERLHLDEAHRTLAIAAAIGQG